MDVLDRILIFIAMLSLVLLSLVALLLAFGLLSLEYLGTSVAYLYGRLDVGLVALLLFLAGIRLFFLVLGNKRQTKCIISRTELGEIKISLVAIENLIQKSLRGIRGIRETKTRVKPVPGGVLVKLRVVINPEHNVPVVSREVQEAISLRVRESMGIEVEEVEVLVDNIGSETLGKKVQ